LPAGWYVGRPSYHDERHEWTQYAFDQREQAKVGVRSREWTAVGGTRGRLGDGALPAGAERQPGAEVGVRTSVRGLRPPVDPYGVMSTMVVSGYMLGSVSIVRR